MKNSIIVIALLLVAPLYAQIDTSYTVIHDIDIKIDTALRNFVPAKEQTKLSVEPVKQKYELQEYPVRMKRLKPKMPIYRIKMEKPPKPLRSYMSLGFGNYGSASLEAGWVNEKTNKSLFGGLLDYEGSLNGPVDQRVSGQSDLSLDLFSTQYLKNGVFDSEISYERIGVGLYGYDTTMYNPERSEVLNTFQLIEAEFNYSHGDTMAVFKPNFGLNPYYLFGSNSQSEFNLSFDGGFDYYLDKFNRFGLYTDNYIATVSDSVSSNSRYLFNFSPYYSYFKTESRLRMKLGLMVSVENDTLTGLGKTHVYPNAQFDLTLVKPPGLRVYGGISGGIKQNHLRQFVNDLGYLSGVQSVQNSNELLNIEAGAKTTFLKRFTFDAGVKYSSIQNLTMYRDQPGVVNTFNAVYDTAVSTRLSFSGELIYNYGDRSMFGLELKFNDYKMGSFSKAFYLPSTEISLTGQHQISDRVNVGVDFTYLDGRWGYDTDPAIITAEQELDPIVDLSLNAQFKINKRWHAWTNLNNVFNKQYSYYLQYPSKGTNFLLGLNYSL